VLQSEALTERYIQENDLLPILFPNKWDAAHKRWIRDTPTLQEAFALFEKIRTVSEDKKTGLVRVTIIWTDRLIVAKWANDLVSITNESLRDRAIRESQRHIAYLNEQLANTDQAPIRMAINGVLESEIKSAMFAKGTDEYALKVLDPAVIPNKKSGPKRALWVLGGALLGMLAALAALYLRNVWRAGDRE
jgi:uncharacterized protein involved in exopolysaccharide biosynthesis